MTALEDEAREAYARFVARRNEIEAGTRPWSSLADFFTDDAVFMDPAWGRTQGKAKIVTFLDRSMAGLEDWSFAQEWTIVHGNRVISFWWNRLPGTREDGSPNQAPAVSILHYAGGGLFSYELDILNMGEVGQLIASSGWQLPTAMNMPPRIPDRDPTPSGEMATP
jgi:ketosteroid isomerase-like protein